MPFGYFLKKVWVLLPLWFVFGCGSATVTPKGGMDVIEAKRDPFVIIDLAEDGRYVSRELLDLAGLSDREVKTRLALALGRIGSYEGVDVLSALACDKAAQVRKLAYFSLGLIAGDGVLDLLKKRLTVEKSPDLIGACLGALGQVGGESVPDILAGYFENDNAVIRAAALRAMGIYGAAGIPVSGQIITAISLHLTDLAKQVRFMSVFALYRIVALSSEPESAIFDALRKAATQDSSPDVRGYAIRTLAKLGKMDAELLKETLADKHDRISAQAAFSIGLVKGDAHCVLARQAMIIVAKRLTEEPSLLGSTYAHTVRAALEEAAKCRANLQIKTAAASIYQNTTSEPIDQRSAATAKVKCLASLVADYDDVSLVACDPARPYAGKRMLSKRLGKGKETSPEAIKLLSEMLTDPDPRVVLAALDSLGPLPGNKAKQAVLAAFEHHNPIVVSAVFDTLAANGENFAAYKGTMSAIELALKRYLPFNHAQAPLVSAAAALAALKTPQAIELLSKLAIDPRPAVRSAVLSAYDSLVNENPPKLLTPIQPAHPITPKEKSYWRTKTATATIITTRGSFVIDLNPSIAPATVASFVELATDGYFDDSEIHRVVPNFVIQAGDPTGTGLGDPDYMLRCEVSPTPYIKGTVGMALAGKDTGGSQFFVTISPQPHLDGKYTVFGHVTSGMDTVELIEEGDSILSIDIDTPQ